jgi:hypothetical protein
VLLLLSLSWAGCAYARDRCLDLTDVVDLKYALGGRGIGAKVRASEIGGTGVGAGRYENVTEWIGRRTHHDWSDFFGIGVFGFDRSRHLEEWYFTVCRIPRYSRNKPVEALRFGAELMLPFARGGLFLNVGEVLDFILGFATLDIADDDGLHPGAPLDSTPESHPIDEEESAEEGEESR